MVPAYPTSPGMVSRGNICAEGVSRGNIFIIGYWCTTLTLWHLEGVESSIPFVHTLDTGPDPPIS